MLDVPLVMQSKGTGGFPGGCVTEGLHLDHQWLRKRFLIVTVFDGLFQPLGYPNLGDMFSFLLTTIAEETVD